MDQATMIGGHESLESVSRVREGGKALVDHQTVVILEAVLEATRVTSYSTIPMTGQVVTLSIRRNQGW